MATTQALGTFDARGDRIDVRFERHYRRPVETVWSALTDPVRLADWMGVSHVEPYVGGRIELMMEIPHGSTGRVRVWDPPRVLEFSWSSTHAPDSVVRYELTPDGDSGTHLVFTHQGMPYENSALMLPGWHDYFGRLGSLLEGAPPREGPNFRAMQATYIDRYQLEGVRLDP